MKELFEMWGNTRMVVLAAITGALYAAILIPFKVLPIIPGITELRPANAIPILCSFLFGPAAAWGAAMGNVIGDFFGGFGPGDLFGFMGNFLYGLLPYKMWAVLGGGDPVPRSLADWMRFALTVGVASLACATVVGWGLNLLGFHPFSLLAPVVFLNNFITAMVLAPILLSVLYPRVARARLLYRDVMDEDAGPTVRRRVGLALVIAGVGAGFVVGNLLSLGWWVPGWLPASGEAAGARALVVGVGLVPTFLLVLLGLAIL